VARQAPQRDLAPAVQRLRLRYAKRGRLRFASHRDFQRAFERALRRAQVPIAFSAGFTPHPRISYANAAPTGVASEAEYLEIAVTRQLAPEQVRADLDASLPPGLDIVEAVVALTPDFADRLQASCWQIGLPGVADLQVQAAIDQVLAEEEVMVQRMTKSGLRTFDARQAVLSARVGEGSPAGAAIPGDVIQRESDTGYAILTAVVRHVVPAVRPDDVLAALRQVADLVPPDPPRITRLAQGPLRSDGVEIGDPFAEDRAAADQRPRLAGRTTGDA
jgi:radical SAM-linked protein